MYEAHWGLHARPFDNTIDPRFFFGSHGHAEAFAKLLYVADQRLSGAMLTGGPGVGKSLVARALASSLPPENYQVAIATAPYMGAQDLIVAILAALGEREVPRTVERLTKEAVSSALERRLDQSEQAGRHPVVLLEDAELLTDDTALGMCRYLMGRTKGNRCRMTLMLIGNQELAARVAARGDLDARLAIKCRLDPLSEGQARAYILHRLQVAGSRRGLFTNQAVARIIAAAGGVPALINRLCDLSLVAGYGLGADRVVPEIVELVMRHTEAA